MRFHTHRFKFESKMKKGHKHIISGFVEGIMGLGSFHFHFFYGVCTYTDHTHYFSGITGLPIKTENGHIHKMEGLLEYNSLHYHNYQGHTFEEVSYDKGSVIKGAYT